MKYRRLLGPWLWMAALGAVIAAPVHAFDDPEDMPEGAGRDEAFYTCVACHSMQVVVRQGMSKPMWDDTLTLMVERHGMGELEEEDRTLILDYLSEQFPAAEASGANRGWTNPFAP